MDHKPTLRGRLLGLELRRVREAAGLTVAELASRTRQSPHRIQRLEDGVAASPSPDPTMWCAWGAEATSVINVLCRTAERIDVYAPLGLHPSLDQLDADRCTAYVLEGSAVDRADVTVRVIPRGTEHCPGAEHPLTRFVLADGPAVVFYAYVHRAMFTEDPSHLGPAHRFFQYLAELTRG
ncbi:helix-turn-helix domain-containing protein [Saccharothrix sp. 6-C]|uniref:Scr1 family TA system antitoxin-like transcriptional regulator n=1 Tax=Saccharothrix sp. 6-C TaxID=2781735 RepID=UPI00191777EF|nr:Scr1 family TA system antitoxin-like transcriptional regulator [Saccharothrix sp. 6-C]QQQ78606.1 helix-turn-helix domain-containing protein [Saccharothrix sp. 6-C]